MTENGNDGQPGKELDAQPKLWQGVNTRLQLAGLAIVVTAATLVRFVFPESPGSLMIPIVLGIVFLVLGQVFVNLEKIPKAERASFLIKVISIVCLATPALPLIAMLASKPSTPPTPSQSPITDAKRRLTDLNSQIAGLRADYQMINARPDKKNEVSSKANNLVDQIVAVGDIDLDMGFRILKYEDVAYASGMAAISAPNSDVQLNSVNQMLTACDKAISLVNAVENADSRDPTVPATRSWLINDSAKPRIQRLRAVALCTRWRIKKNSADLLEVQEIIRNIRKSNYNYMEKEDPEGTPELEECLSGSSDNPKPTS